MSRDYEEPDETVRIEAHGAVELDDDPRRLRSLLEAMAATKTSDGIRVQILHDAESPVGFTMIVTAPCKLREKRVCEALGPILHVELQRLFNAVIADIRAHDEAAFRERERRLREALSGIVEHDSGCVTEPPCGRCGYCDAVAALAAADGETGALATPAAEEE